MFEFGDKRRGKYDASVAAAKGYYPSVSGYNDELLWAALWLYKATDSADYLEYALDNAASLGGITWAIAEFSWDVKFAGVQTLASMVCPPPSPSLLFNREHAMNVRDLSSNSIMCSSLRDGSESANE